MSALGKKEPSIPQWKLHVLFAVGAMTGLILLLWINSEPHTTLSYSDFLRQLQDHNVGEVVIGQDVITGQLRNPLADGAKRFSTLRAEPGLADHLSQSDVKVSGSVNGAWWLTLLGWAPVLFLLYSCSDRCPQPQAISAG